MHLCVSTYSGMLKTLRSSESANEASVDLYSPDVTFTFVNVYIERKSPLYSGVRLESRTINVSQHLSEELLNLEKGGNEGLVKSETQASGKVLPPQRVKVSRGEIHILKTRCKQCRLCIELCPKDVLQESTEVNEKGYHLPEVVEEPETGRICVACGFCEVACPEYAIWVEERA